MQESIEMKWVGSRWWMVEGGEYFRDFDVTKLTNV